MSEQEQVSLAPKEDKKQNKKRRILLLTLTAAFIVIALLCVLYWWLVARFYEETDNAYVNGNIVPITAQVSGTIIGIQADDTQFVHEGQLLIQLDPIDSFIAFEQAKANLGQVVRSTQQLFINNKGLKANIEDRQILLNQARSDLKRRDEAIGIGAVSKEELTHAQDSFKSADASLIQARSALLSNLAQTENTSLRTHPNVLAAAAQLRQAYVNYMRSNIVAPVAGEVAKRNAQVGQSIATDMQLMAIVPLEQIWVDANFKEKQLGAMRVGQPVTLTADIYGSAVIYHGTVQGLSAGTGSAFALLPPQNATGNWIKVVQRLPVRIKLEPKEIKEHPLRIGLSMEVTVDLRNNKGQSINEAAPIPSYKTTVYDDYNTQSEAEINKIISENIQHTANLTNKTVDALNKKGVKRPNL